MMFVAALLLWLNIRTRRIDAERACPVGDGWSGIIEIRRGWPQTFFLDVVLEDGRRVDYRDEDDVWDPGAVLVNAAVLVGALLLTAMALWRRDERGENGRKTDP
jgi:hypothetical protein